MNIETESLKDLLKVNLENYTKNIEPLGIDEYNSLIVDYHKELVAVSSRLIPPYVTSETHGEVFTDLCKFIRSFNFSSVLDIGCGAGECLNNLKVLGFDKNYLYGNTIHVGEVKYARTKYDLPKVYPGDARELSQHFLPNSLDCVIAHCVLQFIKPEERVLVAKEVSKALKPNGLFIVVDYRFDISTGLPNHDDLDMCYERLSCPIPLKLMGNLTILCKKSKCSQTCETIKNWFRQNGQSLYYASFPENFEQYWKNISGAVRTDCRKAKRLGYEVRLVDSVNATDMVELWSSWDHKQNRPINFNYNQIDGKLNDLRNGWSYKNYSEEFPCSSHNLRMWGCFLDDKMVGYLELLKVGTYLVVHSTLAHKDHIKNGIVKQLFIEAIKNIADIERIYYGNRAFMQDNRRYFLNDFLINNG